MQVDHLTIAVTDWQASDAHYGALLPMLGFHRISDRNWSDGDGMMLQFIPAKEGTRPYERYGAGLNHLGFAAESVEEVASIRERLQAAGMKVPDIQNFGDAVALFLPDPDGLRFEISYHPPGVAVVD